MSQVVLHLKAKSDSNGNPRRLYLAIDPDMQIQSVSHVIDEGYNGSKELSYLFPWGYKTVVIEIPVSEYNSWVRFGKEMGIFVPS